MVCKNCQESADKQDEVGNIKDGLELEDGKMLDNVTVVVTLTSDATVSDLEEVFDDMNKRYNHIIKEVAVQSK